MKENFIAHILIPMWVFKMVCKLVKIYFVVLRGRCALRRLEKIKIPEIPTIVQSLLYLMVYEKLTSKEFLAGTRKEMVSKEYN